MCGIFIKSRRVGNISYRVVLLLNKGYVFRLDNQCFSFIRIKDKSFFVLVIFVPFNLFGFINILISKEFLNLVFIKITEYEDNLILLDKVKLNKKKLLLY